MDGTLGSSDGAGLLSDAARPYARGARVVLIGSTALATGLGAHLLGGSRVPGGLGLAALATLCLAVAGLLALGRLRAVTLVPALGALQVALHLGLDVLTPAAHPAVPSGVGPHAMAGMTLDPGTLASAGTAPAMHMTTSPTMVAAHAVAVLVTASLLVVGDRAALAAVRWWSVVRPQVEAIAQGPVVGRRRAFPVDATPGPCRALVVARRGLGRRGPPCPGFALAA
ncbi:hypothetical protein GCM10023221_17010 [Luteimicrobium xylanilyticum]|uniref:Uncharacterized protein n=1 Tax=Luteimicrobium xylanilyticum TaxID=1133546 RepID=A0A5P9QEN4_9MICO|nr:hypothetical protein [Luteimicrobium xylanilyticum]QFU99931.1 hypothetical protein KDY119_03467 [Luteimicrobium xylanilyticum]